MKKMFNLLSFVLTAFFVIMGCMQTKGKISGVVTDSAGAPVADAVITTSPGAYTAATNAAGEYILSDMVFERYTVTATLGSVFGAVRGVALKDSPTSCSPAEITADIQLGVITGDDDGDGDGGGGTVYDSRMVAYYEFDENTGGFSVDSTGKSGIATIMGAAWAPGKTGSALYFDGLTAGVEVGHSGSINLSTAVTVTAWIKPDNIDAYDRIISKSHTDNSPPYTMYGIHFDNAGHLWMEAGSGGVQHLATGSTVISTGTWTHIACTFDGAVMKVFVNGVPDGQADLTGTIDTNTMPLTIGKSGYSSNYFTGIIDEVRIYGEALSDTEIATIASQ